MKMRYAGQATGYIADYIFQGAFSAQYYCTFPTAPLLQLDMNTVVTCSVEVEAQ